MWLRFGDSGLLKAENWYTNNKTCFGPVQGQLRVINWLRSGPVMAHVWPLSLIQFWGHFRAVILCGTWAEEKRLCGPELQMGVYLLKHVLRAERKMIGLQIQPMKLKQRRGQEI